MHMSTTFQSESFQIFNTSCYQVAKTNQDPLDIQDLQQVQLLT